MVLRAVAPGEAGRGKAARGAVALLAILLLLGTAAAERNITMPSTTTVPAGTTNWGTILIGETSFIFANSTHICASGTLSGKSGDPAAGKSLSFTTNTGSGSASYLGIAGFSTKDRGLVKGTYDLSCSNFSTWAGVSISNPGDIGDITMDDALLIAKIFSVLPAYTTESVTAALSGGQVTLGAETNLQTIGIACNAKFEVKDGQGNLKTEPKKAVNSAGSAQTAVALPTTTFPAGDYAFKVKTDTGTCNGLDTSGTSITLKVVNAGISGFKADKTGPSLQELVTVSGTTQPFETVRIWVSRGNASEATLTATVRKTALVGTATPGTGTTKCGNLTEGVAAFKLAAAHVDQGYVCMDADKEGKLAVQVFFNKSGSYEVKAVLWDNATNASKDTEQIVTLTVGDATATVKTAQSTYILGEDIKITGTATAGQRIAIALNNKVAVNSVERKSDGSFEWTWSRSDTNGITRAGGATIVKGTSNYSEGPATVKIWVCPSSVDMAGATCDMFPNDDVKDGVCNRGTDVSKGDCTGGERKVKGPDATWALDLKEQSVEVTSPTAGQRVAKGDSFDLKGTALGASTVFVWVFNSKGTTSGGLCKSETVSVAASQQGSGFAKKFGSEVAKDPGDFTLVVQSLGRDGVYSDGKQSGNTADPLDNAGGQNNLQCSDDGVTAGGALNNKVGSQIQSILQDNALSKAGSDDQKVFKVVQFKVVTPSIKLNACPSAVKGTNLTVTGTSNRADNTTIIVKATGPKELPPVTTSVKNGTYSATFTAAAIGADIGTYTVNADDLQGLTDTVICTVARGTGCSLSVSVSSYKTEVEKEERARLEASVSNLGDEPCAGTVLTLSATPATATVTPGNTTVDVPVKGSAAVAGNFSAAAGGRYTVTVEATWGAEKARGEVTINVGKATTPSPASTTPPPTPSPGVVPPLTPKPTPGFEAVFAIPGLLAVAYLAGRRRG